MAINRYFIGWEIELDASSPEEAAREALVIMRDPNSTATVFDITDTESGVKVVVDAAAQETVA